jgi:hypothetical protein
MPAVEPVAALIAATSSYSIIAWRGCDHKRLRPLPSHHFGLILLQRKILP